MENQGQVNLCICLFVGISLMGFSVFGFCIDSSSFPSKGGTSEQNLDLENSKSGSFGYSTYIMQSYFEKYECLDDSRYKDFVAQELPLGLCDAPADNLNLAPGLSVLERKLIGEGSHRHLSSSIRISIQPRSIYELSHCNCGVILIERLPCGVFADPFELQHLLHRVLNDIAVFGDTNLESPSFLSNRSAVEVHMDVGCNFLRQKTEIDIKLDIPLHARYQPLNETGYSEVRFGASDLFLRCSVARKLHNQSCLYMIENDGELHYGIIVWKIPSGKKAHAGVVYVFTFISASFAVLLIVLTSICHSNISRCKSLKQS
ncbi:uncharacterized protein LOC21400748 isoform X2 [Morus notabilis]|uniref:uncharacterized protein LOC21400748 isoform X2 n=1 Tax=Morus notabilis TaxID=981085 RepID=UPI000CED1390|nr:uncharacterized protein LOC21400748 isoform X2 [Morus notabilis]